MSKQVEFNTPSDAV